jgi:branched-chain amino acid aminotransferase
VSPHSAGCLASLDGEIALASETSIPVTDEGLLRGDGIFEVVRVYEGQPFRFEDHLARLERSSRNLRLPVDLEAVRADAHRLLAEAGIGPEHETLRIVITRGGRRLLLTEPRHELPARIRLRTITYSPTRVLDGIKSLSYAANMLAARLAREQGGDEALLVTPHGRVLEAPTSSIFWVAGGELLTPPLDEHILASITRQIIVELGGAREAVLTLDDLRAADEAFLASTVREVLPIAAVDEHEFPSASPVGEQLAGRFAELVERELAAAR